MVSTRSRGKELFATVLCGNRQADSIVAGKECCLLLTVVKERLRCVFEGLEVEVLMEGTLLATSFRCLAGGKVSAPGCRIGTKASGRRPLQMMEALQSELPKREQRSMADEVTMETKGVKTERDVWRRQAALAGL